ncbi:MAG: sensor histidine kinase [Halothece sp.]
MVSVFTQSRRNLARWFTFSMGSIVFIFALTFYQLETRDRLKQLDQTLYRQGKLITNNIRYELRHGTDQIQLAHAPILGSKSAGLATELTYVRWYNPNKKLLRFVGDIPSRQLNDSLRYQTLNTDSSKLRQATIPVYQDEQIIGYLQIAVSLENLEASLARSRFLLSVGVPISWGIIATVGWFLGGLAMQPIAQAYQRLEQFTANASHQLRSPLARILSNAQVGLLKLNLSDQDVKFRLENIVKTAKIMSQLVNDLLFLARQKGKLPESSLSLVDVSAIVWEIIQDQTQIFQADNKQLISNLPAKPIFAKIEVNLFSQALLNLLDNARKYSPDQGMIEVKLWQDNHFIHLIVKDNGEGIKTEDLPHIWEGFYRGNPSEKDGFGLGLAIAQHIIQAHNGKIKVDTALEKGTSFWITFRE